MLFFFFFKQKTAYERRISDWSSDVCSSDLIGAEWTALLRGHGQRAQSPRLHMGHDGGKILDLEIEPAGDQVEQRRPGPPIRHMQSLDRSEERRVGKGCVSKC